MSGTQAPHPLALTAAGKRLADALTRADAVYLPYLNNGDLAALNAAAEILGSAEGAGLREALETANVELCALVADPDSPDFGPACPNAADAECLTKALTAIRTALASPQPAGEGPVAAGVKDGPVEKAVWAASRFLEHLERVAYRDGAGLRLAPGHVLFDSLQDRIKEAKAALTPPADPETGIQVERIGKDRQGVSVIFARSEYDSEAHRLEEPLSGLVVVLDVDGTILSLDIPDLKADMTTPVEGPADPKPTVPGNDAGMREGTLGGALRLLRDEALQGADQLSGKRGEAYSIAQARAYDRCLELIGLPLVDRDWLIDVIRKDNDPRPNNHSSEWNDGAETIADQILAHLTPQTGSAGEAPKTPDAATGGSVGDGGLRVLIEDVVDAEVDCVHDSYSATAVGNADRSRERLTAARLKLDAALAALAPVGEDETGVREAAWRPMKDAPADGKTLIVARHQPNEHTPHGWIATILRGDGDEESANHYDQIIHYNGDRLQSNFRGMWTGWMHPEEFSAIAPQTGSAGEDPKTPDAGAGNAQIAQALSSADWSGVNIGNKALISAAIAALAQLAPVGEDETERKAKNWPSGYQETFDAIAKAVTAHGAGDIGISVKTFYRALAYPDAPQPPKAETPAGVGSDLGRAKLAFHTFYKEPRRPWGKLDERDQNRWLAVARVLTQVDLLDLREALTPFADCCHNHFHDRSILDQFDDSESVLCLIQDGKLSPTGISVGHLRRATAALSAAPAARPGGGVERVREALDATKAAADDLAQVCIDEGDSKAAGALQFISGFISDRLFDLAAAPAADGGRA